MKTKLHLYISEYDDYLEGQYNWAFTVFADKETGDRCRKNDPYIYVGEFEMDVSAHSDEATKAALDALNKAEQTERAEHTVKMNMLSVKRANLLAITHEVK